MELTERIKVLVDPFNRDNKIRIRTVVIEFDNEYATCILHRPHHKHLGVYQVGEIGDTALGLALELLAAVVDHEKKLGDIDPPDLNQQQSINGYCRRHVDSHGKTLYGPTPNGVTDDYIEIEFKRREASYVISGLNKIDYNGFTYVKKPYDLALPHDPIGGYIPLLQAPEDVYQKAKQITLAPSEELYYWDSVRALSGSTGFVVVKDGKVIKTKGLTIS